jgi:hypothetical protein
LLKRGWNCVPRAGATSGCGGAQVSLKAQCATKLIVRVIDSLGRWRYSQAQIPDLVANAIPRFRLRAKSFGSGLAQARGFHVKPIENLVERTSGAEARVDSGDFVRGLKSPSPSGLGSCAGLLPGEMSQHLEDSLPRELKPRILSLARSARLKPRPFKAEELTSTRQRRNGGSRFL